MILFALAGVFFQAIPIAMFLLVGTYATKLGKEYYHFSVCGLGKVLKPEHRYKELNAFTSLYCGMLCGSDRDCKSFDYDETKGRCYLGSKKVGRSDCEHLIDDTDGGVQHYAEGPQCIDGKEPQSDKTCRCPTAYGGPGCHTRMEDCSDWTDYFEDPVVMWIWPNNTERPFQVFCTKLSNVRTVLMNREVGDVDFQRDWQQYRDGFGNPTGDHWLGLHYMHLLTDNKRYKLRFSMKLGNESDRDAIYMTHNHAIITNESSHYTLYTGASKNVGGPVVDCIFPDLVGIPFSTRDVDNDGDDTIDCSNEFGGGWWFNGTAGCAACNPTGRMPFPSLGVRNGDVDELHWNNTVDNLASVTILMYLLPY